MKDKEGKKSSKKEVIVRCRDIEISHHFLYKGSLREGGQHIEEEKGVHSNETTLQRLLVRYKDKIDPEMGIYTIDKGCGKKTYVGETMRNLKTRVKEHRQEIDKIAQVRSFIREMRKQSETDMWTAITPHLSGKSCHISSYQQLFILLLGCHIGFHGWPIHL